MSVCRSYAAILSAQLIEKDFRRTECLGSNVGYAHLCLFSLLNITFFSWLLIASEVYMIFAMCKAQMVLWIMESSCLTLLFGIWNFRWIRLCVFWRSLDSIVRSRTDACIRGLYHFRNVQSSDGFFGPCIYLSMFCGLDLSLDSNSPFLMFAGLNYLCVFLQPSLSDWSMHLRFTSSSECAKLRRRCGEWIYCGLSCCSELSLDSTLLFLMFAGFSCLWVFFCSPISQTDHLIWGLYHLPNLQSSDGFFGQCICLSVFCCLELSLDSKSLFLMFAGFNYLCIFLQLSLSDWSFHLRFTSSSECAKLRRCCGEWRYWGLSCCSELLLDSTLLFLMFVGCKCLCVFLHVCCCYATCFAWCTTQSPTQDYVHDARSPGRTVRRLPGISRRHSQGALLLFDMVLCTPKHVSFQIC